MLHCHRQHGPAVGWAVMEERELYLMLHCHRQHGPAVGWAVMEERELYLMLHCHRQHGPAVGWAVMEERELYLMLHCHRQHSSAVGWAVMGVSQFNGVLMWGSKPHGSVYETTQSGESGEPKRTHIDVCLHARFVPYCLAKQAHINSQMA